MLVFTFNAWQRFGIVLYKCLCVYTIISLHILELEAHLHQLLVCLSSQGTHVILMKCTEKPPYSGILQTCIWTFHNHMHYILLWYILCKFIPPFFSVKCMPSPCTFFFQKGPFWSILIPTLFHSLINSYRRMSSDRGPLGRLQTIFHAPWGPLVHSSGAWTQRK